MRVAYRRNNGGTEAARSMNASFNGVAFGLEHMEGYSICIRVTETQADLIGTLKLQASNNAFKDNTNNSEAADAIWVDITGASEEVDGSEDFFFNVSDAYYGAVRVVWTRTSGPGTADILIRSKGPQS